MTWRLLKLVEFAEEVRHEAGNPYVTIGVWLPCEHCHHVANRDRWHRCASWDEKRIHVVGELIRQIGLREGLVERDGEEVNTAVGRYISEKRYRCTADMDDRRDVAVLQFLHAGDLLFVLDLCLDAKCAQRNFGRHGRTAATDINVDALAVQVLNPSDVLTGKDMDLLVVQLCDVANVLGETRKHVVLLRVCQRIGLDKADIDAPEIKNIGEILQGALPEHRHHTQCVVIQNGQVRASSSVGSPLHACDDADGTLVRMSDQVWRLLLGGSAAGKCDTQDS